MAAGDHALQALRVPFVPLDARAAVVCVPLLPVGVVDGLAVDALALLVLLVPPPLLVALAGPVFESRACVVLGFQARQDAALLLVPLVALVAVALDGASGCVELVIGDEG